MIRPAAFNGVVGHSYRFYTTAVDNVGNLQSAPGAFQTTSVISVSVQQGPPPPSGYTVVSTVSVFCVAPETVVLQLSGVAL